MDARVKVRIPAELKQALDDAAKKMNRDTSEIVRLALTSFLHGLPAHRVHGFLGSLESGLPHLAERHREYIIESVKRGG
ncbi:MAG TPA: ribbon-helix-helix protein, CopG family [Candidatus Polarisedimenticolaceae bacterium]|nr:ribbon-helix-helix protein, CopG family [Candidatus Polarisedimenticolaceae bacterium]